MTFLLIPICLMVSDGCKFVIRRVGEGELIYDLSGAGNEAQLMVIQLGENSISDDKIFLANYPPRRIRYQS
jgi:hypothetical protein